MPRAPRPYTAPSRLLFSLLLAVALPIAGQAQDRGQALPLPGQFVGADRVTAVDVLVEMPPPGRLSALRGGLGAPKPRDFLARVDGVEQPVVAVDPPYRSDKAPWTVLLYFDLTLSDRVQTAWAAGLLWERADELTELGPVELVVADPKPRTLVPPTRNSERLVNALARLELGLGEARSEDLLVSQRLAVLQATGSTDTVGAAPPERAEVPESEWSNDVGGMLAEAEAALVCERLDSVLLSAVERATAGPEGGVGGSSRRLLLLSTGGWDLEPGLAMGDRSGLASATDETAYSLAAYGWTVIPLLAPPAPGALPGKRIGKWRLGPPVFSPEWLPLLTAKREADRDPELARVWLELARTRWESGDVEGTEDAAEQALVHFADDPRTASEQAETLVLLAAVYRRLGDPQLARRELQKAAARDPEAVAGEPELAAVVRQPEEAVGILARATLGAVALGIEGFGAALERLERRGLVSIQLGGLPDGRVHRVTLERRDGEPVEHSQWVRFGTPEPVAAARARRLLYDAPSSGGGLPVIAAIEPAPETEEFRIHTRADLSSLPEGETAAILRATVVTSSPVAAAGGPTAVVHSTERVEPVPRGPWAWHGEYQVELTGSTSWVVVVEDLLSGRWGAAKPDR